jgi:hypothetical protein
VSAASAGASLEHRAGRRAIAARRPALALLVVAIACAAGCSGDDSAPSRLLDGSELPKLPVELEDVSKPVVLTTARVLDPDRVEPGTPVAWCVRSRAPAEPAAPLVHRVGVASETLTFRDRSGRRLQGCDDSIGSNEEDRWCGGASGTLFDGELRDPRLSMAACTTSGGDRLAFVWVEPTRATRYLVVDQPGYAEAYVTAGGLPIRIATTSGIVEEGYATFDLSEHDADGRLLREYRLDAAVAG